ncbi:MAG: chemotaxis protein CheW [Beijerinckiaceae bacterium]|nr:chemotaxis protein CheW [Beijerinckiaceae bacterium]
MMQAETGTMQTQVAPQADALAAGTLTVMCGGEWFGLPIAHVYSIFSVGSITPVPLAPPEIIGLINVRGAIVTAVSLRRRLRMTPEIDTRGALAVVLHQGSENFALLVDHVADVVDLGLVRPLQKQPHIDSHRVALTRHVYRIDDRIVPVLDVAALLDFHGGESRPHAHAEH